MDILGKSVKITVCKMASEGKNLINALYHDAVISLLSTGYAMLGKAVLKGGMPKLDLDMKDLGMLVLDVTAASATEDYLVKQRIIPANITK